MSTDEIIKIISDEFENHLTEIDNWNDAILKLDKQLFLNRVQQALDLATVSDSCSHYFGKIESEATRCAKCSEVRIKTNYY